MELSRKIQLLEEHAAAANDGKPNDFNDWKNRTDVLLRNLMGNDSPIHKKFKAVQYSPSVFTVGTDFAPYKAAGVRSAVSLLNAAKLELELAEENAQSDISEIVENIIEVSDKGEVGSAERIFIVHGHDDAKKHELARFLRSLTGIEPVILHEQASGGGVLIEKLEKSAQGTGFAVVLLTADDLGRSKKDTVDKPRGRQNVVFELGFFMAALGRENVAVLMDEGIEEIGDVKGLVYTLLDAPGAWKTTLARELNFAGVKVDWSALGH